MEAYGIVELGQKAAFMSETFNGNEGLQLTNYTLCGGVDQDKNRIELPEHSITGMVATLPFQ